MNPAPEGFRVLSSYSNIPSLCLPTATEVTYGSVLIFGRCNTELSCAAESPTEGTPAIGLPANQRRTLGVSFSDLLGKAISRDAMPRSPTAQRGASCLRVCFSHRTFAASDRRRSRLLQPSVEQKLLRCDIRVGDSRSMPQSWFILIHGRSARRAPWPLPGLRAAANQVSLSQPVHRQRHAVTIIPCGGAARLTYEFRGYHAKQRVADGIVFFLSRAGTWISLLSNPYERLTTKAAVPV